MEAIVKITKKALKTVVRDSLSAEEMLAIYLTEIESLINGRPLIPISDDVNDMDSLIPNHYLLGKNNPNVNISIPQDNVSNSRTKWKYRTWTGHVISILEAMDSRVSSPVCEEKKLEREYSKLSCC